MPQWNCGCPVCALARAGDLRVKPSTQASLALTGDGESFVLVNASPDLPRQIAATPALAPRGPRHSPVAAVVLTGAEIDQVAGLLSLRERQPFRLIATERTHAILARNPIFDALAHGLVERLVLAPDGRIEVAGLTLRAVPVPGKAPLYLEDGGVDAGETIGLVVEGEGLARLAYVPSCSELTPLLRAVLASADIVLLDGTLHADDEMIAAGLGPKTGRRMGHLPMTGAGGTLDFLRALPARRKLYTHINNTNPVLVRGSDERRAIEEAGIEIAYDGLEIAL